VKTEGKHNFDCGLLHSPLFQEANILGKGGSFGKGHNLIFDIMEEFGRRKSLTLPFINSLMLWCF
jgi:hypothetical protein